MADLTGRPGRVRGLMLQLHQGLVRWLWPYQAVCLIVRSESQWNRIAQAQQSFVRVVGFYCLPMILTLAGLEGWGLKKWVRWHDPAGLARPLTTHEAVVMEATRVLMLLASVAISAGLIKVFADTFRVRNTYQQAVTVVIYCFAPVCLLRVLLVFYPFNDWLLWAFGIVLCLTVLYSGLPRSLQLDPTHALGLYFSCALSLLLITLLERFITLWYFEKACRSISSSIMT
jgi:hypothetical protein